MLVKVQFPSGRFDEMAIHLAEDPRLQKKFGFRIVTMPETVEELKKEIELKKEPSEGVVKEPEKVEPEVKAEKVKKSGKPKTK